MEPKIQKLDGVDAVIIITESKAPDGKTRIQSSQPITLEQLDAMDAKNAEMRAIILAGQVDAVS